MKVTNHSNYIKQIKKKYFVKKSELHDNDVLLVIDMQNDFIDRPYTFKGKRFKTGKLATYNAKRIVKPIAKLINVFKEQENTKIIASRDYHSGGKKYPDHCSFPIFGEHCVWFTAGSLIAHEIERKLVTSNNKFNPNCHVVFKAIHPKIDSFGAFPYIKKNALKRVCGCTHKKCPVQFTGGVGTKEYIKYPNISTLKKNKRKLSTKNLIRKTSKTKNTIYICGILGDFCVLDTAINARAMGYRNVVIVIDLIRNLRIKEKGEVTYPTPPEKFMKLADKHKFKFVLSKHIKSSY